MHGRIASVVCMLVACKSDPVKPTPESAKPVPVPVAVKAPPGEDASKDAPPSPDGAIGTAHVTVMQAMASDASWMVICQSREDTDHDGKIDTWFGQHGEPYGDTLMPYLVLGTGTGMPIEQLASYATDNSYVAVVHAGRLELIEGATRQRWVLDGADTRDDDSRFGGGRAASIAANGTRMVYLRHDHDRDAIVIRELPSGTERTVPVTGVLWRANVDATGRWARIAVMREDTNHDGKLAFPTQFTSLAKRGCRGPVGSYSSGGLEGDEPTWLWLDLDTGKVVEDPTILRTVGDQLLRVGKDGSIRLGDEVIAPPECNGQPHGIIHVPPRVLLTCGPKPDRKLGYPSKQALQIFGPRFHKSTSIEITHENSDRLYVDTLDWHFYCDDRNCVDFATGDEFRRPVGVEHQYEDHLLVESMTHVWSTYDLKTRKSTTIATGEVKGYYGGPEIPIDGYWYDSITGKRLASASEPIFARDARGRVLVDAKSHGGGVLTGPLHWEEAK